MMFIPYTVKQSGIKLRKSKLNSNTNISPLQHGCIQKRRTNRRSEKVGECSRATNSEIISSGHRALEYSHEQNTEQLKQKSNNYFYPFISKVQRKCLLSLSQKDIPPCHCLCVAWFNSSIAKSFSRALLAKYQGGLPNDTKSVRL